MNRRRLLGLVGGAVAWPLAARGQKIVDMRHVAVLMSLDEKNPEGKAQLAGFVQRLAELGWSEGQNLKLEIRWSAGNLDQIRTFARELVASQPDVILAASTPVTAALHRETQTIPVVFVVVSDPVGDGFVASLAHPGRQHDWLPTLGKRNRRQDAPIVESDRSRREARGNVVQS